MMDPSCSFHQKVLVIALVDECFVMNTVTTDQLNFIHSLYLPVPWSFIRISNFPHGHYSTSNDSIQGKAKRENKRHQKCVNQWTTILRKMNCLLPSLIPCMKRNNVTIYASEPSREWLRFPTLKRVARATRFTSK